MKIDQLVNTQILAYLPYEKARRDDLEFRNSMRMKILTAANHLIKKLNDIETVLSPLI